MLLHTPPDVCVQDEMMYGGWCWCGDVSDVSDVLSLSTSEMLCDDYEMQPSPWDPRTPPGPGIVIYTLCNLIKDLMRHQTETESILHHQWLSSFLCYLMKLYDKFSKDEAGRGYRPHNYYFYTTILSIFVLIHGDSVLTSEVCNQDQPAAVRSPRWSPPVWSPWCAWGPGGRPSHTWASGTRQHTWWTWDIQSFKFKAS